ncbi:tail protein [Psychrobacillus phage Perkons]|nr:tail protein [Psychrobacillus phage Perkons]
MLESTYFMYDGLSSKDFGVKIGTTKGGLYEESFLPTRNIIEKKVTHREKNYLQRVEHDPLSFSLPFYMEDWNNDNQLREIARWLFQPYYKPLILDSNPNRIFYAMINGSSKLFHNGLNQGYVEMEIRCDSPYSYTAEHDLNNIEYRDSNVGSVLENDVFSFDNGSHLNTITTSNGLTVESVVSSWGDMYATKQKWGELV